MEHTDDFKLKSTNDKTAPVTLVRLILAACPLTEKTSWICNFQTRVLFLES